MIGCLVFLALAGGVEAEARRLYEAGEQAYEQGRYPIAIDAFEAAHRMAPRAVTAFALAQAYRLQYFVDGNPRGLERAVELYRAYLELAPDGNRREHAAQHLATLVPVLERIREQGQARPPPAPPLARTQVIVSSRTAGATVQLDGGEPEAAPAAFTVAPGHHRVVVDAPEYLSQTLETMAVAGTAVALNVALDPQPAALEVRAPAGARVAVDGQLVGSAPLAHAVEVAAGRHVVAVTDRGRQPWVREVEAERGGRLTLEARLARTGQRWASYVLVGAGVALVVGSAAAWGLAAARDSEARGIESTLLAGHSISTDERARYQALQGERDDLVRAGAIVTAAGAAVAAIGLVLWAVDRPEAPAPVVAPVVAPGGAGLVLEQRF
jgi:hypothetical protein